MFHLQYIITYDFILPNCKLSGNSFTASKTLHYKPKTCRPTRCKDIEMAGKIMRNTTIKSLQCLTPVQDS